MTSLTMIEPSTPAFVGDLTGRRLERATHDVYANSDIVVSTASSSTAFWHAQQQSDAAAGDDAVLDSRHGGVRGILDAGLASPSSRSRWQHRPDDRATPPVSFARRSWSFSVS